jgi:hypothetical protein
MSSSDSISEQYFPVQQEHEDAAELELHQTLSPSKSPPASASVPVPSSPPPLKTAMQEVNLNDDAATDGDNAAGGGKKKKNRVPRRTIHCSDGVVEEYSTDEEELEEIRRTEVESERKRRLFDPKTLTWVPWMIHNTWVFGSGFIGYCDFFGEKLAWFFGITSPKYYYELQEFRREQEREEERKEKEDIEIRGWREASEATVASKTTTTTTGAVTEKPVELDPAKLTNLTSDLS